MAQDQINLGYVRVDPADVPSLHLAVEQSASGSDIATTQLKNLLLEYRAMLNNLPASAERDAALGDISEALGTITGSARFLPANINAMFDRIQRATQELQQREATEQSQALVGAITLSAEAQARVNYRMDALMRGDGADYYLSGLTQLDPQTREFVGRALANDPVLKETTDAARTFGSQRMRRVEMQHEQNRAFVEERIANAATDAERGDWQDVQKYQLMRMPGMADRLKAAAPGELHQLIQQGVTERVQLAHAEVNRFGRDTVEGALLRSRYSPDGYSLDDEGVRRILIEGQSPQAEAAVRALSQAGGNYNRLPESQRALAAAGMIAHQINANYSMQSNILMAMNSISKERSANEVGHEENFSTILNKDIPRAQRVDLLVSELREHGDDRLKQLSDRDLRTQAFIFLRTTDAMSNPQEAVLGLNGRNFQREADAGRLGRNYDHPDRIAALQNLAGNDPTLQYVLSGATRILNSSSYDDALKQQTRERLDTAASIAMNPEYRESLSVMRYYNLGSAQGGAALMNRIISGELSPADAARDVQALRQDTLTRMEPYNLMVPERVQPQYLARLQNIPGMLDANGNLNVENLIEKARRNRDDIDARGQSVAQLANLPWNDLSEEMKDVRSVARTAAMFKAVDLVRNFGAGIVETSSRPGPMGQQLSQDLALYEAMTNTYGITEEAQQRKAIDDFLKRDPYYASNAELRGELTNFVIDVSRNPQTQQMLTNTQFLQNRDGQLKPEDYGYYAGPEAPQTIDGVPPSPDEALPPRATAAVPPTAAERRELAAEGTQDARDALFTSTMEDRIKDAVGKMDMQQIVARYGKYFTGEFAKYNEGRQDNITRDEIENLLQAAAGITDAKQITGSSSTRFNADQLENALKNANFTRTVAALPVETANAPAEGGYAAPAGQPAPLENSRPLTPVR